ncbi:MAG: hypothetical protein RL757_1004 [Bacteroidota bacterium]|jgi:hypothetical protein
MENEILDGENRQSNGLTLSGQDKMNLYSAGGWARFLGMAGMIFLGLYIFVLLWAMTNVPGAGAAVIFFALLFIGLGFFTYFLFYRFGARIRQAVSNNDQDALSGGLADFKNYMLIIGIIAILFLSLFVIMFLIVGASGMAALMQGGRF